MPSFSHSFLEHSGTADMFIWKMNRKEIREYCNDKIADNPTNNPLESVPCNPSERQNLPSLSLEV